VYVDAEAFAEHTSGVADAAAAVDGIADGDRMDDFPVLGLVGFPRRAGKPVQVAIADFVPSDGGLDAEIVRKRLAPEILMMTPWMVCPALVGGWTALAWNRPLRPYRRWAPTRRPLAA
jgi:hypothetical protein